MLMKQSLPRASEANTPRTEIPRTSRSIPDSLEPLSVPSDLGSPENRHSDPVSTAKVYTDPALLDVDGAIDALPELPLDRSKQSDPQVVEVGKKDPDNHATIHARTEGDPLLSFYLPVQIQIIVEGSGMGGDSDRETQEMPNNGALYDVVSIAEKREKMVGDTGLEPVASAV